MLRMVWIWEAVAYAAQAAVEVTLDVIFPLRERAARTKQRAPEDIPLCPTIHELLGVRIITLADYREPAVQDLVQSLKYDRSQHAAVLAAKLIEEYIREELASDRLFSQKKTLLVPVPLHASRERDRGFNQVARALAALPPHLRNGTTACIAPEVLVRTKDTRTQTKLSRSERLSNVAGAFSVPDITLVGNTHVILIDDVVTTGATLTNAATPLRRAGARVTLLALARA